MEKKKSLNTFYTLVELESKAILFILSIQLFLENGNGINLFLQKII